MAVDPSSQKNQDLLYDIDDLSQRRECIEEVSRRVNTLEQEPAVAIRPHCQQQQSTASKRHRSYQCAH